MNESCNLIRDWDVNREQIPPAVGCITGSLNFTKVFGMIHENNISKTELLDAIQELYYWQYSRDGSNFTYLLYSLFCKADQNNSLKLQKGFPAQAIAHSLWNTCLDQDVFFKFFKVDGSEVES